MVKSDLFKVVKGLNRGVTFDLPIGDYLSASECRKVQKFHSAFPNYAPAPLVSLKNLAEYLGISGIFVKDESYRFGLNAFKVLGASYAVGNYVAQALGKQLEEISFEELTSAEVKNLLGEITFTTATDGNHGRAVAWAAQKLGQKAVIYLPKGTSSYRVKAIEETGAKAIVTDLNYDEAVNLANDNASKNGWVLVQDTAWEGYTEIPKWIMQGYTTMAAEAYDQLKGDYPTHVIVQAGVGSMAAAVIAYLASVYEENPPQFIVVEPDAANCMFHSAQIGDGNPHSVGGDLCTIMAGLACGTPNPIGWEIIKRHVTAYVSCAEEVAARGTRILSSPLKDDPRVISGESGSVGLGLLSIIMTPKYKQAQDQLGLSQDSKVLFFSTEGGTDPVSYRKIVWDGMYSTE
jgi:diaminopropionate ammonia-lyase